MISIGRLVIAFGALAAQASGTATCDAVEDVPARRPELALLQVKKDNSISSIQAKNGVSPVIIDVGEYQTTAGFAFDEPAVVFPSAVGRNEGGYVVGEEALARAEYPLALGKITEEGWPLKQIWEHAFRMLEADPRAAPVMLTVPSTISKEMVQTMAQILFRDFKVPKLFFVDRASAALFEGGKPTGVVVDSGEFSTVVVPIYEGIPITDTMYELKLGGRDVTKVLRRELGSQLDRLEPESRSNMLKTIRDKYAYVAQNFDTEEGEPVQYETSDGYVMEIKGSTLFHAPELLFQPGVISREYGEEFNGIPEVVTQVLSRGQFREEPEVRAALYGRIWLAGKTANMAGFARRLQRELDALSPDGIKVHVVDPPRYPHKVWTGASILSGLSNLKGDWVSREEFDEDNGAAYRKSYLGRGSMIAR